MEMSIAIVMYKNCLTYLSGWQLIFESQPNN